LTGAGTLINDGILAPGFSVGALAVDDNFAQTAGGVYEVELGSLVDFDTLDVNCNVDLDGTLRIVSLAGYTPTVGNVFTIMTFDDGVADASDLNGAFANLVWQGFTPGIGFSVSYFAHSIVLNAIAAPIPLPAPIWLLLSGVFGLARTASRRGRAQ
jgi:hypothetical protein